MSDLRERAREISREFLRETFHADGSGSNMDNALQAAILRGMVEALEAEPDEGMIAAAIKVTGDQLPFWDYFRAMAAARAQEIKDGK